MKKAHALVLAIAITLLIASNYLFFEIINKHSSRESVIVSRVIDGDTLVLQDNRTLRLLNVNAPEKSDVNSFLAKEFLSKYENKSIEVEITDLDKYERYLARLFDNEYLNLKLVKLGLSSKFLVDNSELKQFASAEKQAIESGIGIWEKSSYFGCFNSQIDATKEQVILTNNCPDTQIKNFYLKDESRKIYKFKINSFNRITLHTEQGIDNTQEIYWNSKTNIWNNDRDSLYILDNQHRIVHYNSYGY